MTESSTAPSDSAEWKQLIGLVRQVHGFDVSRYAPSFLASTVLKRRQAAECVTFADYVQRLSEDRGEGRMLLSALLNHHSALFRDPLVFAQIAQRVLPTLVAKKATSEHLELRLWSAGCAAGQEAYSLAILLTELSEESNRPVPFRIFATDTSEAQLALARAGLYQEAAMRNVRLGHLERWFSRHGPSYLVAPALRERVHFSTHDLLAEGSPHPPESIFGEFDLVLCCNVLYYYRPEDRHRILRRLKNSLAPDGYLVTDEAELDFVRGNGFGSSYPATPVFQRVR